MVPNPSPLSPLLKSFHVELPKLWSCSDKAKTFIFLEGKDDATGHLIIATLYLIVLYGSKKAAQLP
jgi:hypothetical protein